MNLVLKLGAIACVGALVAGCKQGQAAQREAPLASTVTAAAGQRVPVTVDGAGYHPETINLPAGSPVTLVFTRTSDDGCGQQLVFPTLGIRRDLPLNHAVEVALTSPPSGNVAFTCGMGMYRGTVVVR